MRTVPLLVLLLSRASAWEQQEHAPPHPKVLQLLTSSADWLLDHSASGICLRKNGKCEGVHPKPAWTGKSDDDGGNYVTGNLARTLLAAGKITGNKSYTDEGLAWADTFCTQQRNTTSAAGSPAGFWPAEIYFADTGTGVTALAYAVHLADTPWRKARYLEVLTRYASYVLEGCASPPGNESTRWGHPIGTEPHPYSWIIQTGPDAGALGDGYWNGTLNDWPYTIATATTGAAFFAELFALTENDTYKTVANGAVDWLIRKRAPNGANIYTFDHPDRNDGKGATILTETTTYPTEGFISVDRHIPGSIDRLRALNNTVQWVISMQATNGSLGVPMTPGGERATRIASLLQWAALRLDGDVATAAQAALERWVDYIVSEQGAWETGVKIFGLPTGFVGLALADLVQPWITWSPPHSSGHEH